MKVERIGLHSLLTLLAVSITIKTQIHAFNLSEQAPIVIQVIIISTHQIRSDKIDVFACAQLVSTCHTSQNYLELRNFSANTIESKLEVDFHLDKKLQIIIAEYGSYRNQALASNVRMWLITNCDRHLPKRSGQSLTIWAIAPI